MKKLLFFLLLIFLFSCEKKDECYECTTVITTVGSPYATNNITTTTTSCGISEADARKIEKELTATATTNVSGYTITSRSVCNCRKQ